ncbi:NAD+ kinase [Streptosporangium becharense]|uniref:NAD kinase n=1 Tax=Streptosporangium becharense TaxID=1816182 RepID=A0A7W9MF45_9ACTN|nr:NAD kinase [Streptosporangium becharense]MBB2915177.1 NAD+ kinase [Streptosporangium becharense]MBB5817994.1 NAD+ kinase [Streptosporangium becharense]
MTAKRTVLVTAHTGRKAAVDSARLVIRRLLDAGLTVRVLNAEAEEIACAGTDVVPAGPAAVEAAEMMIVLGGDGSLLRAAELARPAGVPLLGVNLGHVGFLAEAEVEDLAGAVDCVVLGRYDVEERMTIEVTARLNGTLLADTWALNEATVEKSERMLEVVAEVDGRPLSRWGCDGVICATPTGSTAYAFSAGGPVVWPEVEALLLVPISAHALFARPLVVSPRSRLALEVQPQTAGAVLWCDGRRRFDVPAGTRVELRRGGQPVRLARLHGLEDTGAPFTDRLVAKFGLPVQGWRGRARP